MYQSAVAALIACAAILLLMAGAMRLEDGSSPAVLERPTTEEEAIAAGASGEPSGLAQPASAPDAAVSEAAQRGRRFDDRGDEPSPEVIEAFERLDKWRNCERKVGPFLVYKEHRKRAAYNGFPSSVELGQQRGLSPQEVAALFGWTTGDFRFVNPIARGGEEVTFDDFPLGQKTSCHLLGEEVEPYLRVMSSALRKLPYEGTPVLWRGHRRVVPSEPGAIVTLAGFSSFSNDRDEAIAFAGQANAGSSPHRVVLLVETHRSGRSISRFSARKNEAEVLFPIDTKFHVLANFDGHNIHAGGGAGEKQLAWNSVLEIVPDPDERAVAEAERELRRHWPEATIKLIRLEEVP